MKEVAPHNALLLEETIFNAAVQLSDPVKRATYLELACEGNTPLRQRIEKLLATEPDAERFFKPPPADTSIRPRAVPGTEAFAQSAAEPTGSIIGRYKLREKIGEGGCGVVYVAEQEEPVRRQVALKVIKLGMDTKSVIARFDAERQALAMMDHPNIAKVLDAGATETGRPYFVMELVRGIKITDYCDQNKLTTQQRLVLFIKVCQAVQHAHQKAIIHRDLKPSNVLVTLNDGVAVPKIIDFGIAKATEGRLTDLTVYTELHQLIGTPAYMSPEQALMTSVDIDTRSDIYSLGVLLYELLVGSTPFDPKELTQAGLDAMRQTIRKKQPLRPSTRVSKLGDADLHTTAKARGTEGPRLLSQLRGDLDWIVMKCLEKDRNRRYETANGLAADLRRHLNNEPIVARPPSTVYRIDRFVRRHRIGSAAVALVLVVVVFGGVVSTWALVRERAARVREQAALRQANQRLSAALAYVDQVLTNVAPEISFVAGGAKVQDRLLQAGLNLLRQSAGDDPAARVALARLLLYMSERQNPGEPNSMGDYEAGLKHAKEALELLGKETLGLSESERLRLLWQGNFAIVQCLFGLGRWDEGVERSAEMELLSDKLERFPEQTRRARRDRMMVHGNVGWAIYLAGRPQEALEKHLLPLLQSDWARKITDDSDEDELNAIMVAHDNAASAYGLVKNFHAMLPHAREALRICELLARRAPGNVFYRGFSEQERAWYGYALSRTGQIDAGLTAIKEAREVIDSHARGEPPNEALRRNCTIVAGLQALAFAGCSEDAAASFGERREHLARAEAALAEAEQLSRSVKSKTVVLSAARAEIPAARAKLEADERAQGKP
jgi:serine/threonine protein kinase